MYVFSLIWTGLVRFRPEFSEKSEKQQKYRKFRTFLKFSKYRYIFVPVRNSETRAVSKVRKFSENVTENLDLKKQTKVVKNGPKMGQKWAKTQKVDYLGP
jgi:hypothetical protein